MFQDEASIQRLTLTDDLVLGVSGGMHTGRLILRFTADTRISLNEGEIDYNYMMFQANTVIILDPPNLLSSSNLWIRLDTSVGTGAVELLRC
tara:strand:+ start:177 stop:452 length:276 start_codon:yes stop_codon:yes gene_type:complete